MSSHLQRYSTLDDIQRRVDPTVALYGYDIPRGGVGSRPPPRPSQFVARRERPPGGHVDERRSGTSDSMQSNDESSKLTKEEQEKVLKMLRKEWYNPNPTVRMITNNVGLYYRDRAENANYRTPMGKGVDEEDSKRCAICLDDFEVKSQVTVTPCNHMFHEDCIVPWLKSQGQCPVCRFAFCNPVR
ncbi:hypothetical protein Dimus_009473 [Dionaea muscipula]